MAKMRVIGMKHRCFLHLAAFELQLYVVPCMIERLLCIVKLEKLIQVK